MKRVIFLCLTYIVFLYPGRARAIYDPLSVPNNRYGIHVADPNDIPKVKELVNSSQGDWGYVTIVISDNQRQVALWRPIFERMKRDHLIPIVRIATHVEDGLWVAPARTDAQLWADFLDGLPWPTKNRYVVIFNEPNHAKEWGGAIRPNDYADILVALSHALKARSEDFFVLPAGMDASAPNGAETMDEVLFLQWMIARQPTIADAIDGWTSHSYPNPGFSGSPFDQGRGTIRTFEWELGLLSDLDVFKKLPVFITETGWSLSRRSPEEISQFFQIAADTAWSHPQVAAITPFLFNYQDGLFAMFSWLGLVSGTPYPFYHTYQNIQKFAGEPQTYPTQDYLALLDQPLTL